MAADARAKVWSHSCSPQPGRYPRCPTSGPITGAVVETGTSPAAPVHASLPAAVVDVNPPAASKAGAAAGTQTRGPVEVDPPMAPIAGAPAIQPPAGRRCGRRRGSGVGVTGLRRNSGRGREHGRGLPGTRSRCTK
ncbi:hypothetical protein NDU88_003338 [Pleurodeles waltl]|uniref:Uncharacterized protein n=1 Tax=Pleurodeles waltl TaxID=8319 RepID=A0AAV7L1K2_PLEWA|nr:hypothetical protein NDU88_003338 [Pleurodeles waltl]